MDTEKLFKIYRKAKIIAIEAQASRLNCEARQGMRLPV
jgi:hypothetical protein